MELAVYIMRRTLLLLIDVVDVAFLLRAIFSWFDPERSWRFSTFLYLVTEPLIVPVRTLCYKKNWFQSTPLDVPFLITILLLSLLQTIIRIL
jgi:uncharacterized protein YggT (Ycf19 family)